MAFSVRVYFDDFGNLHKDRLIGQVRRLADEFGLPGIVGKRNQTNQRIHSKGYLRIVWRTREQARRYQDAVAEFWGDRVSTKRFRVRNK
ncbi:hypothetical protein [Acetobacter indonesiensis]|uniref:hypothetical protein n=1 Tax=Acetobacter indonesiensis TaxID=104101 RepID=UPI0039EA9FD0